MWPMNVYDDRDRLVTSARNSVEVSSNDPVEIEKMYGPLIFADLRVTADNGSCEWVIERSCGNDEPEWREWARVPGQLDEDFADEDDG